MVRNLNLLLFICSLVITLPCLAIKLKFRYEECLNYDLEMYGSVYGSFVAMADAYGMTAKYDLTVHSPAGTKVYDVAGKFEHKFNMMPYEDGKYKFCVMMSRDQGQALSRHVLTREVVWDLHETKADHQHDKLQEGDTASMWRYVSQVESQLAQLKSTQQYLYWRERSHRITVEATNKKVWWWAMARSFLLISVSVGQVLYIRRLFSK